MLASEGVVTVQPVVNADGTSRKSGVPEAALARGGGHLCPYELYVYIGETANACRVTMGFTKNRKFLHTYYRTPPERVGESKARGVFEEACERFGAMVGVPDQDRAEDAPPLRHRWKRHRSNHFCGQGGGAEHVM